MPLVPLRAILEATDRYQYAQGAFNVNAVAQAKAAIEVHEMFRSAAILQGADLANGFMGGRIDFMNATLEDKKAGAKNIAAAVKRYGESSPIPIALHLDHGRDIDSCGPFAQFGPRLGDLRPYGGEADALVGGVEGRAHHFDVVAPPLFVAAGEFDSESAARFHAGKDSTKTGALPSDDENSGGMFAFIRKISNFAD